MAHTLWSARHVDFVSTNILNLLTTNKVKILFYPMLPDFRKRTSFWEVLRLRPFVLLVRVNCRRRWACNIGGMILTGGKRSTRSKTYPSTNLSITNITWTDQGSNPGFRDGRPATNGMDFFWSSTLTRIIVKWFSSYRAVNTPSRLWNPIK
jgi:hypothetical protein